MNLRLTLTVTRFFFCRIYLEKVTQYFHEKIGFRFYFLESLRWAAVCSVSSSMHLCFKLQSTDGNPVDTASGLGG